MDTQNNPEILLLARSIAVLRNAAIAGGIRSLREVRYV
jgi:hypothetical protein